MKDAWIYLIKSENLDREILNPALAIASTLKEDSTVLKILVLQIINAEYVINF